MSARTDVEKLLQWAFRHELPKKEFGGFAGGEVSPMFRLADLGVRVDEWSSDPGFPAAMGEPHPDALVIETAVMALPYLPINWPRWRLQLMGNIAGLLSDDDPTLSALNIGLPGLVAVHARMGTRPRWDYWPLPEPVIGRNGKPVVKFIDEKGRLVEGRRGRHYGPLSRCPLMWFPAPREAAFARIEYTCWRDTLAELARKLGGKLKDHEALPPAAPPAPWQDDLNHARSAIAASA